MPSPDNAPGPPPIADPSARPPAPAPMPDLIPGDWATAPQIIKGWAWFLAIVGSLLMPCVIDYLLDNMGLPLTHLRVLLNVVSWFLSLFQVYGIRQGVKVAWYLQIVASLMALPSCFGLPFHGFLLFQWFKPEVKAWFRV